MKWETKARTPSGYRSFEREAELLDYAIAHPSPLETLLRGIEMMMALSVILENPRLVTALPEHLCVTIAHLYGNAPD